MISKQELDRLTAMEKDIRRIATEYGLQTRDVIFEIVSSRRVIEGMAYRLPVNFSHWSFGRDFERQLTIYQYANAGIPYEMVWNFETPKAFVAENLPLALKLLVMAHVFGHDDFFLNSRFCQLGRKHGDLAERARNAAHRFREYEEKHGLEVEEVIDAGFSLEWHMHPDLFFEEAEEDEIRRRLIEEERAALQDEVRRHNRGILEPSEVKKIEERLAMIAQRTPPAPTHDLLGYLIRHSPKPLKPWMQDVLSVIRHQARALVGNAKTQILNEGWATYWHVRIMRRLFELGLITSEEHGIFANFHSLVTAENEKHLNPYRLGSHLYEHVKERWDKGRFGREYNDCADPYQKAQWDTGAGLGTQKIFQVRAHYSNRMAVEDLFSDEFIRQEKIYLHASTKFSHDDITVVAEKDPATIRAVLKNILAGGPNPVLVTVENGDHDNHGNLYLNHHYSGFDLDHRYRDLTLEKIYYLWGRKVYLETSVGVDRVLCSYDGNKHRAQAKS